MKTFFQKMSSRKLWVCIVGVIFGLAVALGASPDEIEPVAGAVQKIAGYLGAIASCIAYILGEAKIDAAGASDRSFQSMMKMLSGRVSEGLTAPEEAKTDEEGRE